MLFFLLLVGFAATPAAAEPVYVRQGENVVVTAKDWGIEGSETRWYRLKAVPLDYNNVTACGQKSADCLAPIRYRWEKLDALDGTVELHVGTLPQIFPVGTHRIRPVDGAMGARPVPNNAREVVIRRNDTYVGRITELIGTPFVFFPKNTPKGHQTDLREGADCVSTVIYGQRRLGRRIPYVGPAGLDRFTALVPAKRGEQPIRVGDVLHFGAQTAVVSQDLPPLGVLGPEDRVIHAHHRTVEEIPWGELPYATAAFEVRRWQNGPAER